MTKKHELKVIKVPIKGSILSKPQVFPRMPRLYLELIENKQKIKQDLINKEYIPPNSIDNSIDNSNNQSIKNFENRLDTLLNDDSASDSSGSINSSKSSSSPSSLKSKTSHDSSTVSTISELSIDEKDDTHSEMSDNLSDRLKELLNDDSDSEKSDNKKTNSHNKHTNKQSNKHNNKQSNKYSNKYSNKQSSDSSSYNDKYSNTRDKNGHSIPNNIQQRGISEPPTLSQLESNGGYLPKRELRDINQTNPELEQQEEDSKRELLFKFDLLRKSYPIATIPEYNIHTDLSLLEKSYRDCVRRLSLDSTVENYKTYLVYGFMGCEFIFGNFLGFDMQGFTQQQIISMHSYEKLLIELGEKSYVPTGSTWPVELRLLFMIIMNAAFFVISKMMMKKTGANLMGMVNSMTAPKVSVNQPAQKRKMRGPNIDLDDIPNL